MPDEYPIQIAAVPETSDYYGWLYMLTNKGNIWRYNTDKEDWELITLPNFKNAKQSQKEPSENVGPVKIDPPPTVNSGI